MDVRVLLWLLLLAGVAWVIWEGFRPGATSRAERLKRIGLALTVNGVVWTVLAWWMLIPELVLLTGVVLLLVSRRAGTVS